jgi:hypothetical protein
LACGEAAGAAAAAAAAARVRPRRPVFKVAGARLQAGLPPHLLRVHRLALLVVRLALHRGVGRLHTGAIRLHGANRARCRAGLPPAAGCALAGHAARLRAPGAAAASLWPGWCRRLLGNSSEQLVWGVATAAVCPVGRERAVPGQPLLKSRH